MLADLLQILEPKGHTLTNAIGGGVTLEAPSADQFRQMLDKLREAMAAAQAEGGDVSESFALRQVMSQMQGATGQSGEQLLSPDAVRQLSLLFQQPIASAADVVAAQPASELNPKELSKSLLSGQLPNNAPAEKGISQALRQVLGEVQNELHNNEQATTGEQAVVASSVLSLKSGLFENGKLKDNAAAQLEQLHAMGKLPALAQELNASEFEAVEEFFAAKAISLPHSFEAVKPEQLSLPIGDVVSDAATAEDKDVAEMLRELHAMLGDMVKPEQAAEGNAVDAVEEALARLNGEVAPLVPEMAVIKPEQAGADESVVHELVKNPLFADSETLSGSAASDELPVPVSRHIPAIMPVSKPVAGGEVSSQAQPAVNHALDMLPDVAVKHDTPKASMPGASNMTPAAIASAGDGVPSSVTPALPGQVTLPTQANSELVLPNLPVKPQIPTAYQPPADQIIVSMRQAIETGDEHIRIQLKPAELGRVDVHMDVAKDGHAQLRFVVDNPDTLDLLQRDARGLLKMLEDIGIKSDSKQLQFSLNQQQQHGQQQGSAGDQGQGAEHANEQAELEELLTHEPLGTSMRHQLYQLTLDNSLDIQV